MINEWSICQQPSRRSDSVLCVSPERYEKMKQIRDSQSTQPTAFMSHLMKLSNSSQVDVRHHCSTLHRTFQNFTGTFVRFSCFVTEDLSLDVMRNLQVKDIGCPAVTEEQRVCVSVAVVIVIVGGPSYFVECPCRGPSVLNRISHSSHRDWNWVSGLKWCSGPLNPFHFLRRENVSFSAIYRINVTEWLLIQLSAFVRHQSFAASDHNMKRSSSGAAVSALVWTWARGRRQFY